mmetsp:Transcript_17278/g.25740  ORF Transcript_17278/g.25740 Transcript_17278/m.25740 type:complete len:123 (-) Transcript_17278:194-562(-)
MDFQDIGEEFVVEDVETVVKSAMGVIPTNDTTHYNPTKVHDWSNSIMAAALKGLQSLNRHYKYAITVIFVQKVGAGLVAATSMYWDTGKDGLCKVKWENNTMQCIVTVYGTAVNIDSNTEFE